MTDDLHLFTEDGTEYVLPGDFFAGPLKPGTRGVWGVKNTPAVVVAGRPDVEGRIVVMGLGQYLRLPDGIFTPDPSPRGPTVLVPMSADSARWIVIHADYDTSVNASLALREAGME